MGPRQPKINSKTTYQKQFNLKPIGPKELCFGFHSTQRSTLNYDLGQAFRCSSNSIYQVQNGDKEALLQIPLGGRQNTETALMLCLAGRVCSIDIVISVC